MSLFRGMTESQLRTDRHGRRLVTSWGLRGRWYVLDQRHEVAYSRLWSIWSVVMLVSVVGITMTVGAVWNLVAVPVALLVAGVMNNTFVSRLQPSEEPAEESPDQVRENVAVGMGKGVLWFQVIGSCFLIGAGLLGGWLSGRWSVALPAAAFFAWTGYQGIQGLRRVAAVQERQDV
jgi:hypothetical protein